MHILLRDRLLVDVCPIEAEENTRFGVGSHWLDLINNDGIFVLRIGNFFSKNIYLTLYYNNIIIF